jgi:hypothetical protein
MVAVKKEDDGTYSKCSHGRTLWYTMPWII